MRELFSGVRISAPVSKLMRGRKRREGEEDGGMEGKKEGRTFG